MKATPTKLIEISPSLPQASSDICRDSALQIPRDPAVCKRRSTRHDFEILSRPFVCLKGSMRQHHKSSWGFNRAFLVMPLGLIFKPCFPDSNVDLISVKSPCFMLALSAIQRGWEWDIQPTQQVLALLYATLVSSSYILLRTTRRIQQPSTPPSHSLVWLSSSLHTHSLFHFSAGCQVLCCCVTKIPLPPESPMWCDVVCSWP